DGTAYLAMPLVDGMPIDRWCTQHALSIRERVRLFSQVVDAIAFAQKSLIVHRDLKPGNVLVSHNGQVSVLDFGIAKLIDDGSPEEQTSTRVLTPKFGAPEQWSGAPVTTATDVYALGATLYVLLCDELPDPDESKRRKGLDGVDRDLKNVVGRAMQSESERRYDGALALGQDLRRWLDGRPVLATPDSLSYRLRKYVRRNRAMVAASALGVSALCAGATLAFSQAMEARRQTHVAQAMTQFLIDSFQSADPYRGDEEMSARQIVAHGIKRVDVALADIPEARGQMLFVLGDLSGLLGQYEQSESLLSRALKNDLEPRQRFRAVTRYGHTLTILGRYDAAETQFQEASRLADALRLNFDERAVFETERASYLLEARRHDEALNALNTVMNQPDFDKDLSLE
ncbi:MAG: serine/threonine-protein kinase, partial [Myxococcota bacterium]